MIQQALDKIDRQTRNVKLSPKANAVKTAVADVLRSFCEQNSEFAQALLQSGKTVGDCIEYTVSECGNSISDIDVFRRAAEYFFAGATVRFEMILDIGDGGFSNTPAENAAEQLSPAPAKRLRLSLDELF